ncbi:ABC transporter ATP-binding protein [Rubrivivax sp. A210]|uniref:energy-coupling factor ABC transporter ATP-binding protein n=1 Tax=Rubrivivax sp. A210 TaxID=2772301 RepID=UPI001918BF91|nr:ABC transporter ATP-binding protein [Rubrivivax sp. A210]CAD5375010.1 ABC transporter ATP-binding protein [Rubrivivax sp. A210]
MATPAAVELRDLAHVYPDGTAALRGVDLRIEAGETVALVGANGAGKSTLLAHLNGLLTAAEGQVLIAGMAVAPATLREIRRRVGYVFQQADDQLFMPTVAEDVAFGPSNLGLDAATVAARVQAALERVAAAHLSARAPWRLSGGEKRAVAIAGVLAMAPEVLVLDEPSSDLDPAARRRLIELLKGLPQTLVLATHDLALALEVCRRVVVLSEGRVRADGAPAAVFADAALLAQCRLEMPAWVPAGLGRL